MENNNMNRNILFIENNYQLAHSWKKFLELLFVVDVDPAVCVEEVTQHIIAGKYGIIFIHLPMPEVRSKEIIEQIRAIEKEHNIASVPLYVFVLPHCPDKIKDPLKEICSGVLFHKNMVVDAGYCIVRELKIQPKMKDLLNVLDKENRHEDDE
jgi:hypothetical protein